MVITLNENYFFIEKMTLKDLPQVLAIEQASFPTPFTENLYRMELALSVARLFVVRDKSGVDVNAGQLCDGGGEGRRSPPEFTAKRPALPAQAVTQAVIGYMDFWKVADEYHLINIAVHPEHRHKKIGFFLMSHMIEEAKKEKIVKITLDVRPSNESALKLYQRFGFEQVGVRKKYYQDNQEDALTLTLHVKQNS